jgi:hypothetical protein
VPDYGAQVASAWGSEIRPYLPEVQIPKLKIVLVLVVVLVLELLGLCVETRPESSRTISLH